MRFALVMFDHADSPCFQVYRCSLGRLKEGIVLLDVVNV